MRNHNRKKWWYSIGLGLVWLVLSCGSTKTATNTTTVKKLGATKIIANHYKNTFDFNTLNAKVKVLYEDEEQSFSPMVILRMEKDKHIWMSVRMLGITMAKVSITPEKIRYYEKVNGSYFEGDFDKVSDWLGVSLNFANIQRLLVGEAVFNLKESRYQESIANQAYELKPKQQDGLYDLLFALHPQHFKITSQQVRQPAKQQLLQINYPEYQEVANTNFPKVIRVLAKQKEKNTTIVMNYREVNYNAKVTFPFKIPSGYKQVKIP